jgi:uncharacterized protein YukE
MSDVFDAYQEELESTYGEIRTKLEELRNVDATNAETKNQKISEINKLIESLNNNIKQQEVEARSCDKQTKLYCMQKLSDNKEQVIRFKQDLNNIRADLDRSTLMGGRSGDDRRRMIDANAK